MKFRDHKYTWKRPFGAGNQTRHQWQLRGPHGGVHFHVGIWEGPDGARKHAEVGGPSAGLEFHYNVQPYGEPEAAHHSPCWLTGQPCWHDGTSLYASDTIWPVIEALMPDHAAIFRVLEHEYEDHFEGGRADAAPVA